MYVRIVALALFVLLAGCASSGRQHQAPQEQTESRSFPGGTLVILNYGSLPGSYCRCGLSYETIPYRIYVREFVEHPLPGPGFHRLECSVEALSIPVSFSCSHAFETFGNEKVYLAVRGTGLPGACAIERLSLPPEGYQARYRRATEKN